MGMSMVPAGLQSNPHEHRNKKRLSMCTNGVEVHQAGGTSKAVRLGLY